MILEGEETTKTYLPNKATPNTETKRIIYHKFDIYDYAEFHNVISYGAYCFPFTIWLSNILPQSHLCLQDDHVYNPKVHKATDKYERVTHS